VFSFLWNVLLNIFKLLVQFYTMRPSGEELYIFELHHLGDAVMALPFLRAASKKFLTTVYCRSGVKQLLAALLPELDTEDAGKSWLDALKGVERRRRKRVPEISLCAWTDPRVYILMNLLGSPQRIGFALNSQNFIASNLSWRRRRMSIGKIGCQAMNLIWRRPCLTNTLQKERYDQHHVADWAQLADSLGFSMNTCIPWVTVPALECEPTNFFADRPHKPVLVLHPGARLPTKRWPVERYSNVLENLSRQDAWNVIVIKSPNEPCPKVFGSGQAIIETPDFPGLIAILGRADLVLANDSFCGHLAAALGRRVISIFGSGNPDWFAPYGNSSNCLRSTICPHHPCLDRCQMPRTVCLDDVQVGDVIKKISSMKYHTS
jgi:ADP-heptose:LPS heptosyltransferase